MMFAIKVRNGYVYYTILFSSWDGMVAQLKTWIGKDLLRAMKRGKYTRRQLRQIKRERNAWLRERRQNDT